MFMTTLRFTTLTAKEFPAAKNFATSFTQLNNRGRVPVPLPSGGGAITG
jgi:hypothetical protein